MQFRFIGRPIVVALVLVACSDRVPTEAPVANSALTEPVGSSASATTTPPRTSTGFYLPTNLGSRPRGCGSWLGRDRAHGGCYIDGYYHIGLDIPGSVGTSVYAVADGVVIARSDDAASWGRGNSALYVRHTLRNGTKFVALYGHITTSVRAGQNVLAGRIIGSVGRWPNGNHLHFGVRPGSAQPPAPTGMVKNPSWPWTNGFVDPWSYIWLNIPR